jgi:hypothetical protein
MMTETDAARAVSDVLRGEHAAILDLCPSPLSGEWAGESIPELFGIPVGGEWPTDEEQDEYENAYRAAYVAGCENIAATFSMWSVYVTYGSEVGDYPAHVTYAGRADAQRWAAANYPEYFSEHPNGWQYHGFVVALTYEDAQRIHAAAAADYLTDPTPPFGTDRPTN